MVLSLAGVVGCGDSGDSSSDRLGKAFCADLRSGMSVFQITRGNTDQFDSPLDMAAHISLWVEEHCPSQLSTNDGLRGFLEGNGFDPDNLDG